MRWEDFKYVFPHNKTVSMVEVSRDLHVSQRTAMTIIDQFVEQGHLDECKGLHRLALYTVKN